jgi:hypothetical protein
MTSKRLGLAALKQLSRDSSERALAAQVKTEEKREKRKKVKVEKQKAEVPDFALEVGQRKPKLVNSVQVEDWFRDGLKLLYGGKLELPQRGKWWTVGERRNAKRLLDMYGEDLVHKAVLHLCATWTQRVEASEGRLAGIPSIGYLVVAKNTVFAEAQGLTAVPQRVKAKGSKRKQSKDSDEYRPPETPIDVGWYV